MVKAADAKSWAQEHVKGLWASPPVPFDEQGNLHEIALRHNVEEIIDRGADGIGFGYAEPWHLSRDERKRAIQVFVDAAGGRVPTFVHTTDHSAPEALALTRHAQDVGVDAVMVYAPYEFAKSQQSSWEYFDFIAAGSNIAMFIYNTVHSGQTLEPQTIARIADLPAAAALKNGVNDFEHTVLTKSLVGDSIVVSEPLEASLPRAMVELDQRVLLGNTSIYLMQGPEYQLIRDYFDDFAAGRTEQGWAKYRELQPLRDVWTDMYTSVWGAHGGTHPIGLTKVWMDRIGMYGGRVRAPGAQVDDAQADDLTSKLDQTGLLPSLQSRREKPWDSN